MLLGSWSYYQRLSAVQRLIINTRNIITRSSTSTHHNGGKWCSNLPPGGQQRNKFSVSQTAITRDRYGKSGNTGQESLRPKVKRIAGLLLTGGAVAVCIYGTLIYTHFNCISWQSIIFLALKKKKKRIE